MQDSYSKPFNAELPKKEEKHWTPVYFNEIKNFPLLGKQEKKEFTELEGLKTSVYKSLAGQKAIYSKLNKNGLSKGNKKGIIDYKGLAFLVDSFYELCKNNHRNSRCKKEFGLSRAELSALEKCVKITYSQVVEKRNHIVEANLKLVLSIIRAHYSSYFKIFPEPDMMQEGNIGLMRAVEKFNYKAGYKFSSYAVYWIKQSIIRGFDEKRRVIRLPVYILSKEKKVEKIKRDLIKNGEEPSMENIMKISGFSEKTLENIFSLPEEPYSLFREVVEDLPLIDIIKDENSPDLIEDVFCAEMKKFVEETLGGLDKKEQAILRKRFAIDGKQKTLEEVGEEFGVTRERIRQIEQKALKKLRRKKALKQFYI